jgi:hypothetical protein
MSLRTNVPLGRRRLVAAGLSVATGTAVVAGLVIAAVLLFHAKPALGSGTGPGGGCVASPQPVCTFHGNNATADFGSVSSDGCIFTEGFIQAAESVTRPQKTNAQTVFVFMSSFDSCNNVQLEAASNTDPNTGTPNFTGTIHFGTKLASATVSGTAMLFDFVSNTTLTATINLTWEGFGATTPSVDSSHFHGFGFLINSHFNGNSRAAEASGTLSDGTTNFAAAPTLSAELDDAKSGTVQIFKS